jgi:hypothetical protein
MRVGVVIAALVRFAGSMILGGCGTTEGPLLHARDGGLPLDDGGAGLDADSAALPNPPPAFPPDVTWQYQLVGTIDPDLDAQLYVIDMFNAPQTVIDRLHAQGKLAVAYLSAGTLEDFRDDADEFPDAAVGRALEAYPNESWLDVRDEGVRALMAARLDLARSKGFDGMLPTSLTAYQNDSGFDLSAADQVDYSAWLSQQTHARGMHVGMSGDYGQLAALAPHFDWAVDYECIADANCQQLAPLLASGKPVLDVETEGEIVPICQRAAGYGINVLRKRPDFGSYRLGCP